MKKILLILLVAIMGTTISCKKKQLCNAAYSDLDSAVYAREDLKSRIAGNPDIYSDKYQTTSGYTSEPKQQYKDSLKVMDNNILELRIYLLENCN